MCNLLVIWAGILSSNSIPPPHLLFSTRRLRISLHRPQEHLHHCHPPQCCSKTTATLGKVIIQNDEALISHLLTSNFGDYILQSCSRCASEAHLASPGNGPQSSHSDQAETSAPQVPRCKLCQKMWLASPICLSLALRGQRSNLPLKMCF